MDLFLFVEILNALVSGVLRGGLYTALAIGLAITFGLLDIVVIAHPTLIVAASFMVFFLNSSLGLDPIVSGLILTPVFFVFGYLLYQVYYGAFERTGTESLRGLAFFFGLLFIVEVLLIMTFGVDHRLVLAPYIGKSIVIPIGEFELLIAWRLLMPFLVAIVLTGSIHLLFKRTYFGRAVRAVAQDMTALRLMGVDPIRVKRLAFALGISTTALAGALLIIVIPIEPSIGRLYIGTVFAIVVLGGLGSINGTLVAALLLGIAEVGVERFAGASWAPAVSFGILLLVLAFRPQGRQGPERVHAGGVLSQQMNESWHGFIIWY